MRLERNIGRSELAPVVSEAVQDGAPELVALGSGRSGAVTAASAQIDCVWVFAEELAEVRGDALNHRVDRINMSVGSLYRISREEVEDQQAAFAS